MTLLPVLAVVSNLNKNPKWLPTQATIVAIGFIVFLVLLIVHKTFLAPVAIVVVKGLSFT